MARRSDEEIKRLTDWLDTGPGGVRKVEPYYRRYIKHILRDVDRAKLANYDPVQLINAARTQEELIEFGQILHEKWGGDYPWWNYYHNKKTELGRGISVDILDDADDIASRGKKHRFMAPLQPKLYTREASRAGKQREAVQRNLIPSLSYSQATGEVPLFELNKRKMLKNWTPFPMQAPFVPQNMFMFDLETTGKLQSNALDILSFGQVRPNAPSAVYAQFNRTQTYERFIEETILPQYEVASQKWAAGGNKLLSQREMVLHAIDFLEEANRKGAYVGGYNILGFDIPVLALKAKQLGLEKELQAAVSKNKFFDIGEWAIGFMSRELGGQYAGWATETKAAGLVPLGWKQEVLARSLGWSGQGVHEAATDASIMSFLQGAFKDEAAVKRSSRIFRQSVKRGIWQDLVYQFSGQRPVKISSNISGIAQFALAEEEYLKPSVQFLEEKYGQKVAPKVAQVAELSKSAQWLRNLGSKKLGPFTVGSLARGAGIFIGSNLVYPGEFWGGIASSAAFEATRFGASKLGVGGWKKWALAAGATGLTNLLWYGVKSAGEPVVRNRFSGRDDEYNTIPGFPEAGMAADTRHKLTQFGSGYNPNAPLPTSLMGQEIDPRVLAFRENVIDDPEAKAELEARLKAAQEAAQGNIGQFAKDDLYESDLSTIRGINQRNKNLREVHLDRFAVEVEDADTLLLHRRGLFNIFSDPIQIRLSGVDAPEVASHSGDPMAEIRLWQAQAGGEESSEKLRSLLATQDELRLIIDTSSQTYGRSLGVIVGDHDRNVALDMLEQGIVSALPFGSARKDIVERSAAAEAEARARVNQQGIWSYARYQAVAEANKRIGKPITYNVLTEINKLASNLNLGAYGSFLESLGTEQRELTPEEIALSRRLGGSLRRSFGINYNRFSGKDDAYNTIEGLRHGGMAERIRRNLTDFGSGYQRDSYKPVASDSTGNIFIGTVSTIALISSVPSLLNTRANLRLALGHYRGYMDFYHGTAEKNVDSILKQGLIPNKTDYKNFMNALHPSIEFDRQLEIELLGLKYAGKTDREIELIRKTRQLNRPIDPILTADVEKQIKLQTAMLKEKTERVFFTAEPWVAKAHASMGGNFGPTIKNQQSFIGRLLGYYSPKIRNGTNPGQILKFRLPMETVTSQTGLLEQLKVGLPSPLAKILWYSSQAQRLPGIPTIDLSIKGNLSPGLIEEIIPTREGKILWDEARRFEGFTSRLAYSAPKYGKALGRVGLAMMPLIGIAGGVFGLASIMSNKFSGRDDSYNTIEGLRHGGLSEETRKALTDFGSGWDPVRAMAKNLFKDLDEQAAFKRLRDSDMFKSAISKALNQGGTKVGQGMIGEASKYTAYIEHGLAGTPTQFDFIVKRKKIHPDLKALPQVWSKSFEINKGARQKLGRRVSPRELEEALDISRIYGHTYSRYATKYKDATEKELIGYIGNEDSKFTQKYLTSLLKRENIAENTKKLFEQKEKAETALNSHLRMLRSGVTKTKIVSTKNLISKSSSLLRPIDSEVLVSESTAITRKIKSKGPIELDLSDKTPIRSKAERLQNVQKSMKETEGIEPESTVVLLKKAKKSQQNIEDEKTCLQLLNIKLSSYESTGLGFRAAHNGARKHRKFSTVNSA